MIHFFLITSSAFAALAAKIVLVVVCVRLIAVHRKKKHSTPALQDLRTESNMEERNYIHTK